MPYLAHTDEYFTDLLQAYREEFNELYDLGCRNIQIDDPSFCFFCAETMISAMEKAGIDHEAMLDFYIGKYNDLLRGRPKDLTVGVHMCRGNFRVRLPRFRFDWPTLATRLGLILFGNFDPDLYCR